MNTLALAAFLAFAAPTARDDKESLAQAVAKAAALDSYAFKSETEFQSPLGGGPAQIPTFDGKYQKDAGLHIKSSRGEMFRKGDRVLVKEGQNDWTDLAQFQPGTPPPGPDAPKRPRGAAAGPMAKLMLRNVKAPHDELKDLVKGFKTVKKDEKTEKIGDLDCTLYTGEMADDAMKNAPLGRMLSQFGGANPEIKGSGRVWVDTQGNIVVFEIVTKASIDFQGNQIDLTLTRRSEISDAGKVKIEVPAGVQKLLGGTPPVKSEDKKDNP